MEVLITLLLITIFVGTIVLLWCLHKIWENLSYSTKRTIKTCFWVGFVILIICFSSYLDWDRIIKRGLNGGLAALVVMGGYLGIRFLFGLFKNNKN